MGHYCIAGLRDTNRATPEWRQGMINYKFKWIGNYSTSYSVFVRESICVVDFSLLNLLTLLYCKCVGELAPLGVA